MFKFSLKYFSFFRAGVQRSLANRLNFLFYRLGDICGALISYYLWQAIFNSSPQGSLGDFTVQEMGLYVFLTFFSNIVSSTYVSSGIGQEIKDGSIAMRLIKPIDFISTYLFDEIGFKSMQVLISALPILGGLLIFQLLIPNILTFNIFSFFLFIISLIFSYLLNFYFNICFGFSAFILQNLWGANVVKNSVISFMSGTLIPLSFFPSAFGEFLKVLPFSSLVYTPVMIYLRKYNFEQIVIAFTLQICWCLFFYLMARIIWKIVIKHVVVQGG